MDPLWAVIFLLSGIFVGGVAAFVYLQRAYLEEFRSMAERLDRFERSMRPSIGPKTEPRAALPDIPTRTETRAVDRPAPQEARTEPRTEAKVEPSAGRSGGDAWPSGRREHPLIAPPIPGLTPADTPGEDLVSAPRDNMGSAETLPPVHPPPVHPPPVHAPPVQAPPVHHPPSHAPSPLSAVGMPAALPVQGPLVVPARSGRAPASNARAVTLTDQVPPAEISSLVERGADAFDPASEHGLVSLPLSAMRPIVSESVARKVDPTLPMALGEPPLPTAVAQALQKRAQQRGDDEVTQLDPMLEPDMIAQLQAPRLSDEIIEPPLPSESSGSRRVFDEPSLPRVGPDGELLRGAEARTRVPEIDENADPQWVWAPAADLLESDPSTTRRSPSIAPTESVRRDPSNRKG